MVAPAIVTMVTRALVAPFHHLVRQQVTAAIMERQQIPTRQMVAPASAQEVTRAPVAPRHHLVWQLTAAIMERHQISTKQMVAPASAMEVTLAQVAPSHPQRLAQIQHRNELHHCSGASGTISSTAIQKTLGLMHMKAFTMPTTVPISLL